MFNEEFGKFKDKLSSHEQSHNNLFSNIPFLGGRPQRDTIITSDEILNLRILLETSETVEAFETAIA